MTTASDAELQAAIRRAYDCALEDNRDELIEALVRISEWGVMGVHVAVMGWSAIMLGCSTGDFKPDRRGFYSLECLDTQTGSVVAVDQVVSRAEREAMQLVSLYGNQDHDTAVAICTAAAAEDGAASLMWASCTMAAAMTLELLESQPEE